jgi:uncharacterized protein YycO
MKFKWRYAVISFVSVIAASILILLFFHFKRITLVQEYQNELKSLAREGDIICRLGDRTWSLYFKGLSKEDKRFSHLGIIHIKNDEIVVINAEGLAWKGKDYVNETPLAEFIKSARVLGLYRLKGIDGTKISAEALTMTGRPFDWDFNLKNHDKIYCTELLYAVLEVIAPEIKLMTVHELGKDIVPLEAVSASSQFEEIVFLE